MNTKLNNPSRRNFLRVSAAAGGALALGALTQGATTGVARAAARPNHRRLVVINMLGGNDALNTVFPVTGALRDTYLTRRPNIAYQPGSGVSLAGGPGVTDYELHPALVNVGSMWDDDEVAIVHKVGYPGANLSHFVSEDIWSYGARYGLKSLSGVAKGWVARFANHYASTPLGVASLGVGRRLDFEGAQVSPFLVGSVASFRYLADFNYPRNHELRLQTVKELLQLQGDEGPAGEVAAAGRAAMEAATSVEQAVADYNAYATQNGITYPMRGSNFSPMGGRLRDIALLIHGGFETRVFYTGYGGFDYHSGQVARHNNLLLELDASLAAFKQDLTTQGVWNDTVIVIISEFGRRNFENGSAGTDHGHGNVVFVIGPNVHGGMYGGITAANLDDNYLGYDTDFRDVYRNLIGSHLQVNPEPLFPEEQPLKTTLGVV
jgi:uncharacterized protein (DUF1501 family)